MNSFYVGYCRFVQGAVRVFRAIVKFPLPTLISEENASLKVGSYLKDKGYKNPLIVTGPTVSKIGLIDNLVKGLEEANLNYIVFNNVKANPTVKNVEDGLLVYKEHNCDCIIALGGGSPLDCSKMIGARVTDKRSIEQMKGMLKIRHKLPLLVAIPTTAGSASEMSVASVIVNEETKDKYAIGDPHLVPVLAVHDPNLFIKSPAKVTAMCGMDALTHVMESAINRGNSKKLTKLQLETIKMIYENLPICYAEPENLQARKNMQLASYNAGVAFTTNYVGYVHALAHPLGGEFDVAHGLANAVLLPNVIEEYGEKAYKRLELISDYLELLPVTASKEDKAKAVVKSIRELNAKLGILEKLDMKIDKVTLDRMINHCLKEANPLYPVPKEFDKQNCLNVYIKSIKELEL